MKSKQGKRHFLVDIDMLFDLRFALLNLTNPDAGVVLFHEKKYYKRNSDKILYDTAGIPGHTWWSLYEENYTTLLKESPITYLMHNLYPMTNDGLDDERPGDGIMKDLSINVPYGRLTDIETEGLIEVLKEHFYGYFDEIRVVHHDYSQLNLHRLSLWYTDFFCYRWYKWIRHHYEQFEDSPRPSFRMWFPRMTADNEIKVEEKDKQFANKFINESDIFEFFSFIHCPAFELHWVDPYEVGGYFEIGEKTT